MAAEHITPIKAIRAKCVDCMCGSVYEVALCPSEKCPLWAFRLGKNPNIKLSDEERIKRAERARRQMDSNRKDG